MASRAAAQTDSAGFSVIPQLNHYHQNVIRIDPETLPDNADADDPVVQVIPSKGALVPVRFAVNTGYRVIYALRTAQGPVPFAARVKVKKQMTAASAVLPVRTGKCISAGYRLRGIYRLSGGKECMSSAGRILLSRKISRD